jgi:hypothetical protein
VVPSEQNLADKLTRVPLQLVRLAKKEKLRESCGALVAVRCWLFDSFPAFAPQLQQADPEIADVVVVLRNEGAVRSLRPGNQLKTVFAQLSVTDSGTLVRTFKVPPDEVVSVPVVPSTLVQEVAGESHVSTGHGCWSTTRDFLRRRCFFPGMGKVCVQVVSSCSKCVSSSPSVPSSSVPSEYSVVPDRHWQVVQMVYLSVGASVIAACWSLYAV